VKGIHIDRAIQEGRKRKGITQDELARYIGVSKASVSKWETGQSYPDITLLPQLATYFNISIDDLMGYEPQMTKEEIRVLYHRLSEDFANLPFETVMEKCSEIMKKYYSCYPLLLQLAILFLNHVNLAPTDVRQREIMGEIRDLSIRIKEESDDLALKKQANFLEALAELSLGNASRVTELMASVNDPYMGEEVLLASAYFSLGKVDEAKETTQVGIFRHLMGIISTLPSYLTFCTDDLEQYEATMSRALALIELFSLRSLHPAVLFGLYLAGAQGYVILGQEGKALDLLELYTSLATADIYPLQFSGDEFFDKVDRWFEDFDLGARPARSDASIRASMVEALTRNQIFQGLADHERFRKMVKQLENLRTRGD